MVWKKNEQIKREVCCLPWELGDLKVVNVALKCKALLAKSAVMIIIALLKFLYGQSVRFPASFPCLSFPVPFLYIALTKAVLTGLKAYQLG